MKTRLLLAAIIAILDGLALARLLTRVSSPNALPASVRAAAEPLPPIAAVGPKPRPAGPNRTPIPENAFVARFQRARGEPAFLAALDAVRRRTTERIYGPLFTRLELGSAVREQCLVLLLDKQMEKSGAEADHPQDTMRAIVAAQEGTNQRLKDLLGGAGYQAYLEFESTSGLRATVDRFAAIAAASGEPLAPDARERAVTALAAAAPGAERSPVAGVTGLSAEVAAGLVTPPFGTPLPADAPSRLAGLLSASQQAAMADLMLRQEDELALRAAVLSPPR